MIGLYAVASALMLSGAAAQAGTDCTSLRAAVQSYSTATATSPATESITTFNALLDVFELSDQVIKNFGASTVLVPSDQAFLDFVTAAAPQGADAQAFIMSNPDAMKQILLYHFTSSIQGSTGDLHTALANIESLVPWINPEAICGREDSKYVYIKYNVAGDGAVSYTEPLTGHYKASQLAEPCTADAVSVRVVDKVLTPCPVGLMFGGTGCMTIAAAAAAIPEHPFGTLPYAADASKGSMLTNLRNPNLLTLAGAGGATLFLPTAEALTAGGVTAEEFVALNSALDHVVSAHIARGEICLDGPVDDAEFETLAGADYCGGPKAVSVAADADGEGAAVTSGGGQTGSTLEIVNVAVCGGVVHMVDEVLLPCALEEYQNEVPEVGAAEETTRDGTVAVESAGSVGAFASGAAVAAAVAAGALLL